MPVKTKSSIPASARLLTIKAAAEYLSATVWFLRTCVWEKQIPFLKLGNRLLFDRVDLDAFITAQKQGAR
jgi:excisionase family DNA binding protein